MTVPDDVQGGFSALYSLLYLCESGHFYEDHDESLETLGRAKDGFEKIREWVQSNSC